jgi:hypothetical protein
MTDGVAVPRLRSHNSPNDRMKVSEKQELTKKLIARLEQPFGRPPETPDRSVLDSLVYAVCLENDDYANAEQSFAALRELFHDLNEIRVSSITELAVAFRNQTEPELRAHRVRTILQFVFEDQFEFDLEAMRKKTQEQAAKKLGKIRDLSPFIRNYVQQVALGAHLLPMDDRMTAAAIWLGIVDPGTSTEAASEALKPAVRKADAPLFCHLLRRLVTEPPGRRVFDPEVFSVPEGGYSPNDAMQRLDELLGGGKPRGSAKAKATTKSDAKKTAKTSAKREPASKPKSAATKAAAKRPPTPKKSTKGRSRAAS